MLKKTPLNAVHKRLGGHMVEFGGWEMPLYYSSIIDEHKAVRTAAGIFDISHMGEIVARVENRHTATLLLRSFVALAQRRALGF